MDTYYFSSPERQAALLAELKSWLGTRFWERAAGFARKGMTADCVSFAHQVLVNTGAIQPVTFPHYVAQFGGSPMLTKLLQSIDEIPQLERVWSVGEPMPSPLAGDLWVGSSGRAMHHVGIYGERHTLWHCSPMANGVAITGTTDPRIQEHLRRIYRARA